MSNLLELPENRLSTTDETGARLHVYAADVEGRWNTLRQRAQIVLMLIFLVTPWLRFNGKQLILLDLPKRQFSILGWTFWAHEAPDLLFLLLFFVVAIAFITAIFGRLWCGWACPQTVFVDGVFRKIERWVEGRPVARKKLDSSPWTLQKLRIKSLKWFLFFLVSAVISHSFLAYFVGAPQMIRMIFEGPLNHWTTFLLATSFTALFLFDFGWFREQFCIIMCPYGRFQSVLMDGQSLSILYDQKRGEPRGKAVPPSNQQGDCIDCFRCVQVCPTGIDIRRGVQMECIACTACIDACDEIMHKVGKPAGLIRYASEQEMAGQPVHFLRRRTLFYLLVLGALASGFVWVLSHREPVQATVIRAIETPYQVIQGPDKTEEIINHFKLSIKNQSELPAKISLELPSEESSRGVHLVAPQLEFTLSSQEYKRLDFFLRLPKAAFQQGKSQASILWKAQLDAETTVEGKEALSLVGPY